MVTLKHCLQEVARLGPDYVVYDDQDEWTASDLLCWLQTQPPAFLWRRVYMVFPDDTEEGAIYALSADGILTTDVPLYRIGGRQGRRPYEWELQASGEI